MNLFRSPATKANMRNSPITRCIAAALFIILPFGCTSSGPKLAQPAKPAEASAKIKANVENDFAAPNRFEERVREARTTEAPEYQNAIVRYGSGSTHFDGWIETCPGSTANPPARDFYRKCVYVNGRITESYSVAKGAEQLNGRWFYNQRGAPMLWIEFDNEGRESRWTLADYDARGRLSELSTAIRSPDTGEVTPRIRRVFTYESVTGSEDIVTIEEFLDDQRRFVTVWKNHEIWLQQGDGPLKIVNHGSREERMREPEQFGLASYYPIELPK